jgi:hypothetical protein
MNVTSFDQLAIRWFPINKIADVRFIHELNHTQEQEVALKHELRMLIRMEIQKVIMNCEDATVISADIQAVIKDFNDKLSHSVNADPILNRHFALYGMQPFVEESFRRKKFDKIFKIVPSLREAFTWVR